jgi:DNA repair protein RecO
LGKIKAYAKGSRKLTSKFVGHIETLNIAEVSLYFGPQRIIITEISSNETLLKKATKLETFESAIKIAEIANTMLFEEQKYENLISLMKKAIMHLITSKKPDLIYTAFAIKLMDKLGIVPDFKASTMSISEKYIKFFEFIKAKTFTEIEKIATTKEEDVYISKYLSKLLDF